MIFKTGQIFDEIYPPEAAAWCNANGSHIERQDGAYVIVKNAPAPEPTAKEQVVRLELQYNLPRPVRTALLLARARGEAADGELMRRVDEIEKQALCLRKAQA